MGVFLAAGVASLIVCLVATTVHAVASRVQTKVLPRDMIAIVPVVAVFSAVLVATVVRAEPEFPAGRNAALLPGQCGAILGAMDRGVERGLMRLPACKSVQA